VLALFRRERYDRALQFGAGLGQRRERQAGARRERGDAEESLRGGQWLVPSDRVILL
jgi:hypothetical protein